MTMTVIPYDRRDRMTRAEIQAEEKELQAKDDLACLVEAGRIKRDPERYRAALARRDSMKAALESIEPKAK